LTPHALLQIPKIISALSAGKTCVVVADMLPPVSQEFYRHFDSMHVLDATGACVESGAPEQLLRLPQFGARLREIANWQEDMTCLFGAAKHAN